MDAKRNGIGHRDVLRGLGLDPQPESLYLSSGHDGGEVPELDAKRLPRGTVDVDERRLDTQLSGRLCTKPVWFYNLTAIDHDVVNYSDISVTMKLGGEVPAYVPATSLKLSGVTWDSGDQDVPGSEY